MPQNLAWLFNSKLLNNTLELGLSYSKNASDYFNTTRFAQATNLDYVGNNYFNTSTFDTMQAFEYKGCAGEESCAAIIPYVQNASQLFRGMVSSALNQQGFELETPAPQPADHIAAIIGVAIGVCATIATLALLFYMICNKSSYQKVPGNSNQQSQVSPACSKF